MKDLSQPDTGRDARTGRAMLSSAGAARKSRPGEFETPNRNMQRADGMSEVTSTDGRMTIAASLEGESNKNVKRGKKKKKKVTKRNAQADEFEDFP